jgi:hypothetical protein
MMRAQGAVVGWTATTDQLVAALVLEGEEAAARGRYPAGTLLINPPGSRHSVRSEIGCAALLYWEKPVRNIG